MDIKDIKKMKDNIKFQEKKHGNKAQAAIVAATGVAIGVGVAAVAARTLSNKKNRARVSGAINDVRLQVSDSIEAFRNNAKKNKKEVKKEVKKAVVKEKKIVKKASKPRTKAK